MGRNPRAVKPDHPALTAPQRVREIIDWTGYVTDDPHTMRRTRPVARGDVILYRQREGRPVRRALVLSAGTLYLPRHMEWCSWYHVVPEAVDGGWAKLWIRIYDRDIERGYE